jgi:RNA polymerase sigma-70 factor (ECF subfamily)
MATDRSSEFQRCLDRLRQGDEAARDQLVGGSTRRLRLMTRQMLKSFPGVKRFEETDDVSQNAAVRLHRALKEVTPASVPEFFGLAATLIRRELIDLARHYRRRDGPGAGGGKAETKDDPSRLAAWGEFHRCVGEMEAGDRQMFDLLWYQGVTQPEAAGLLGVSLKTVQRRWLTARRKLCRALEGELPE